MSAKLACSAHHICGFSAQRIRKDLGNYSPLFKLVTIHQNENQTSATLVNLVTVHAQYHPLLGGSLHSTHKTTLHRSALNGTNMRSRPMNRYSLLPSIQALLLSQIEQDFESGLDTRALVVLQGDALLGAVYGEGISERTRLLGWSMSKSLLAMLYGRMETLGLADSSTCSLFPEWAGDGRSEITLQNLLQMCDGLKFDETYRPGSDATRMLFGMLPASRYALQRSLKQKPGTHFSYSSGSTNLLARWMHEQLGGTEAALNFWRQEFLQPLGLPEVMMETDGDGVFVGSSYGYATAIDWARLGALYLTGSGASTGSASAPFLDTAWLARAVRPNNSNNDPRYGYQLWLNYGGELASPYPALPADCFFMLGNREQKLMVAPSHNAVIVRLGWSSAPYPVESRFREILDRLPR